MSVSWLRALSNFRAPGERFSSGRRSPPADGCPYPFFRLPEALYCSFLSCQNVIQHIFSFCADAVRHAVCQLFTLADVFLAPFCSRSHSAASLSVTQQCQVRPQSPCRGYRRACPEQAQTVSFYCLRHHSSALRVGERVKGHSCTDTRSRTSNPKPVARRVDTFIMFFPDVR